MKMTIGEKMGATGMLLGVLIVIAAVGGWIANIVKLVGLLDGGVTGWLIGRGVGIFFPPLGAIMGFL